MTARAFAPNQEGLNAYIQNVICSYPTTPKVGDLVRVGSMIGYALEDEDTLGYTLVDFGPRKVTGLVLGGGTDLAAGSKVYFDDSANPITGASSDNVFAGYALGVVDDSGNATISILKTAPAGV